MKIISSCAICGNKTEVSSSQAKFGKGKTCSKTCRNKYARSKQDINGNKNPSWKGGVSFDNNNYAPLRLRWSEDNPTAKVAHHKVEQAIKSGKLTRENCSVCGSNKDIQAHHEDYEKPLDVIWLCRSCHKKHHQSI